MKFFKTVSVFIIAAGVLASCAPGDPENIQPESTARILTSEDGYALKVERGTGRIEVTAPAELCGVVFSFTDTESYLESGEMKIPLSAEAAAPLRDFLVMAYPEDRGEGSVFEENGAEFTVEYRDGVPSAVTAVRGGVTRRVDISEGGNKA